MNDRVIEEAIGRCNPDEPLQPGDPRWQDLSAVRGSALEQRLMRHLNGDRLQNRCSHLTLAGHRGCGKSTELLRFVNTLRAQGYLPLYAAQTDEDDNEVVFSDIAKVMIRVLVDGFRPGGPLGKLPDKTLKVIYDWFKDITQLNKDELERSLSYTGEAGLGLDTPLAKLLWALSASRRMSTRERREVKEAVERRPADLISNLNLLLDDARKLAAPQYPNGLVLIIDSIDRYEPEMVSRALLGSPAESLKSINAHTLFVLPISLLYNPPGETVEDYYQSETLPMVPVTLRGAAEQPKDAAIDLLEMAIFKRVDRSLFSDPALARRIALYSGGSTRELIHILKEALLEAQTWIDEGVVRRAVARVRNELTRKLTFDHYRLLAQAHLTGLINPDEHGRYLLFRRAALEYNGEGWVGVSPLLWETPQFQAALAEEKQQRGLNLHTPS